MVHLCVFCSENHKMSFFTFEDKLLGASQLATFVPGLQFYLMNNISIICKQQNDKRLELCEMSCMYIKTAMDLEHILVEPHK